MKIDRTDEAGTLRGTGPPCSVVDMTNLMNRIKRAYATFQWNRAHRAGDHTRMNKYGRMYHGIKG